MLELNAAQLFGAVTEVRRLATILEQELPGEDEPFIGDARNRVADTVQALSGNLSDVGAQSAWVAAERLINRLRNPDVVISFVQLRNWMNDVESRFADHLSFIKLFVVRGEQLPLLGHPTELLGEQAAGRFTSAWFDCEESAKCLCVQRPTASVFHAMRMLEIGIKAFASNLDIPDPIKPSERNWGIMLRAIKTKIDSQFPSSVRMPGSSGAFLESIYVTLDAVKNPWRNAVMHVEGVYTDAEARFILLNVINLLQKMSTGFDENGNNVDSLELNLQD
jgi:hypothetical protein